MNGRPRSCHATAQPRGDRQGHQRSPSPKADLALSQVIVLLGLAFAILIAIFAVQNTTSVAVSFLTFHTDSVAVSVLVLISALLGAAVMVFLGLGRELSIRWRNRAVAQQLRAAQARVAELEAAQTSAPPAGPSTPAALTPATAEASEPNPAS